MFRHLILPAAFALLCAAPGPTHASWTTMPDGVKLNVYDTGNQNWQRKARLFVQPPMLKEWPAAELGGALVDDADAQGGKAVRLERGGSIAWTARFPRRGIYQVSLYARSVDPEMLPDRVPTYLTLRVGEAKPILLQTNFHPRCACITRFLFHVAEAGEQRIVLAMSAQSDPNTLHIERVRLIDQLGNCAARAGKTRQVLYTADSVARMRTTSKTPAMLERTADAWRTRYEEIWRMAPSPWLPLIHNGGKLNDLPNPKTGEKAKWDIFPTNGKRGTDRYHVTDLNTHDVFPTNDYAGGELAGGDYPDNGW